MSLPLVAPNIPDFLCSIDMSEVFVTHPRELNSFISLYLYVWRGTVRFRGVFNIHIHCFDNVSFYMNEY